MNADRDTDELHVDLPTAIEPARHRRWPALASALGGAAVVIAVAIGPLLAQGSPTELTPAQPAAGFSASFGADTNGSTPETPDVTYTGPTRESPLVVPTDAPRVSGCARDGVGVEMGQFGSPVTTVRADFFPNYPYARTRRAPASDSPSGGLPTR
jgi:hypothetical protein